MLTREQIEQVKRHEQTIRRTWLGELDIELADAIAALIEHAERGPFTEDGVAIVMGEPYWMGTSYGGDMHVSVFMDELGLLVQPGGAGRSVPLERFDDPNAADPSAKLWSSHDAHRAAKGGG